MGEDPKKEKPLTREDVLRLIKENGGTARGLDLSGKTFEDGIDLRGFDLKGIILGKARFPTHFEGVQLVGAKFDGSDLTGVDISGINLQYAQFGMLNNQPTVLAGADLRGSILLNANFRGADLASAKFGGVAEAILHAVASLENTDLRGANLFLANFEGCYFYGTKLEGAHIRGADIYDAHLEEADWGSYVIGEETKKDYYFAQNVYRRLRIWYTSAGIADTAAKFYYREKEANRKALKLFSRSTWNHRLALEFLRLLFGYGESWRRVLASIAVLIVLFAIIYYAIIPAWKFGDFLWSLYFSAVSFTALGYGSWVKLGNDLTSDFIRGVGAFESLIGVSMLALLLVTFFRKWTR